MMPLWYFRHRKNKNKSKEHGLVQNRRCLAPKDTKIPIIFLNGKFTSIIFLNGEFISSKYMHIHLWFADKAKSSKTIDMLVARLHEMAGKWHALNCRGLPRGLYGYLIMWHSVGARSWACRLLFSHDRGYDNFHTKPIIIIIFGKL